MKDSIVDSIIFIVWLSFVCGVCMLVCILIVRDEDSYHQICRDHGGVVVDYGKGGLNCATPDGKWINIYKKGER